MISGRTARRVLPPSSPLSPSSLPLSPRTSATSPTSSAPLPSGNFQRLYYSSPFYNISSNYWPVFTNQADLEVKPVMDLEFLWEELLGFCWENRFDWFDSLTFYPKTGFISNLNWTNRSATGQCFVERQNQRSASRTSSPRKSTMTCHAHCDQNLSNYI